MIKDIVVNLSAGEKASPARDYAVSVAAAFDAHLAGIAFLYDPIVPVSGAGYIPAEVIETQERDNEAATKAALARFTAASAGAGKGVVASKRCASMPAAASCRASSSARTVPLTLQPAAFARRAISLPL